MKSNAWSMLVIILAWAHAVLSSPTPISSRDRHAEGIDQSPAGTTTPGAVIPRKKMGWPFRFYDDE
ncbi:hypothetical protein P691DRAFT_762803 [Macrolepiota fuliginosa MF-IS2]|uniref:Uncharacterized protein n=1 Tax=Macrolepiota fuliginosa MF-IS2 TaxID=1400762 RepID=A0A9P5X7H5_9AGAR|nr:hypothetical protein P691DRAFT_763090 [Macrolepiota fuliginosa MF-IS2]KAF9445094.1 hypothetical protein P691DRAFT_762803 [Macrolepiota fuliginosa MF-IS2]